jgi:hypothetical protein
MSVKRTTVYFHKPGKENTDETLMISMNAAKERGIDTVIVSSTTGDSALKALEILRGSGLTLVIVTHQTGYRAPGVQLMPRETRERLERGGAVVVTCTDVLTGGVDIGMSGQTPPKEAPIESRLPSIVPPVSTIIANTLRMFCQGVKVCVEIAMMAADAGAVPVDKPLIAVAGSHEGSDTAMVITPASSNRIRDLKIHEILAKPLQP